MSVRQPPRLAIRLMDWTGPHDEALLGDLLEEYRSGRSSWWYWRQTLMAIVVGTASEVRAHKLLTLRAVVVGWIVASLYGQFLMRSVFLALRTAFNFGQFLFVTGITGFFYEHHIGFPALLIREAPPIIASALGAFASGWLVGYLHRPHGAEMALVYSASLTLIWWYVLVSLIITSTAPTNAHFVFTRLILLNVCLPALIGGLCGARTHRNVAQTRLR